MQVKICKVVLIILLILQANKQCLGQSRIAYYDARVLADVYRVQQAKVPAEKIPSTDNNVKEILKGYFPAGSDISSLVAANPFLSPYFSGGAGASLVDANSITAIRNSISSSVTGLGNMDVTNFADGLAKFLVARGKEELTVSFFRNFNDFLLKYPEVSTVFPTTTDFIKNINSYQYAAMLPTLRAGFQKDLNAMCKDLIKLRDLQTSSCGDDACKKRISTLTDFLNNKVEGRSIIATLIITDDLINGQNAATAITDVATDKLCNTDDNLSNTIKFTDLVSQSLKSTDAGRVWVTKDQVNNLVNDEITLQIYLGLLYAKDQQGAKIKFTFGTDTVTLKSFLTTLHTGWVTYENTFKTSFKKMANAASDVSNIATTITNGTKNNDQNSILIYAGYASSVSDLIKDAISFFPDNAIIAPRLASLKTELQTVDTVIDDALNCTYDIKSKNYGALVLHTSDLLTVMLKTDYKFKDNFIKYGTFMANIIEAQNSDEVQAAIEATVLPVGSASIKRETPFNISLNAYIGAFGGKEFTLDGTTNPGSIFGVSAPVGVAFSWGNLKCRKGNNVGGKSLTVFLSVINVGQLASFRLQNDSSTLSSEIKLKNIVAPGLSFYYGFGKTPISLGIGAELSPQYTIGTTTPNDVQNYFIKFGASLVVDIPLLNLHTTSKE